MALVRLRHSCVYEWHHATRFLLDRLRRACRGMYDQKAKSMLRQTTPPPRPSDVMGAGHLAEIFRVLKNNGERQHGGYRARCLVLAVWDTLQQRGLH